MRSDVAAPFVHVSESDPSKFQVMSDKDVFLLADHLAQAASAGACKVAPNLLKATGLNYVPNGLLQDKNIRRMLGPSGANYDAMHVYYSCGIFGYETKLLFDASKRRKRKCRPKVSFPLRCLNGSPRTNLLTCIPTLPKGGNMLSTS